MRQQAQPNSQQQPDAAEPARAPSDWNLVLPGQCQQPPAGASKPAAKSKLPIALAVAPLAILLGLTAVLAYADVDRQVAQMYFGARAQPWPLADSQPWRQLYDIGCLPGLLLAAVCFVVAAAGVFTRRLRVTRFAALYIVLVFILGPGVIINGIFKPHWGRPRPRQTADFGGQLSYRPFWQATGDADCRSFPSGHASMGFFLMAPGFALLHRRRKTAVALLLAGLAAGTAIGAARVVQGGHFVTDVLWSAGFVYLVCIAIYPFYQWCLSLEARWAAPPAAATSTTLPFPAAAPDAAQQRRRAA